MKIGTHIYLTPTDQPKGGYQIYKPEFRNMPLTEIESSLQDDFISLLRVGYNSFTFHQPTGTVSVRKIEIKTLQDVFETDIYNLLA